MDHLVSVVTAWHDMLHLPTLTCGGQICTTDRSVVVVVVVEAAAAGPGGAPCGRSVSTLLAPATPRYRYTISTLYTGHHIYTQGDTGPGPGVVTIIAGDTGQSGDTVTEWQQIPVSTQCIYTWGHQQHHQHQHQQSVQRCSWWQCPHSVVHSPVRIVKCKRCSIANIHRVTHLLHVWCQQQSVGGSDMSIPETSNSHISTSTTDNQQYNDASAVVAKCRVGWGKPYNSL